MIDYVSYRRQRNRDDSWLSIWSWVTETRACLERCPAGNLETHLSSPSASSKQALNRLWISRGGREPANVIKGERNHVWRQEKQKQRRETPGGCSYCISENMSPFALLKATPGLVGVVGVGEKMNEMAHWENFSSSRRLGFKSHFSNCSDLSKVSVRSIGYCGICPDCWPIKM